MLEWLQTILGEHYTEDADKAVAAEIGKRFVSKADFGAKSEAVKDLTQRLNEANTQIEGFQSMDIEAIKQSAAEWKEKAEQAEKDAAQRIADMQFEHILDGELSGAKAKNAKAVRALLDMEGLKLNDGKIIGLSEQLDKIKAENDYLFEGEAQPPQFTAPPHNTPSGGDDALRAAMGLGQKKD